MYIRLPVVIAALLGLLVAVLTSSVWWVIGWSVTVAIACLVDVALAPPPRKIQVHRKAESTTRTGSSVAVTLTLTNRAKRTVRGQIRDAWPPSAGLEPTRHDFAIPTGERRSVHATMSPTRRGTLLSRFVVVRTEGPFRLAGRQRSFDSPWELRVLPPFRSRRLLASRIRKLRELDGRSLLLIRGEGTEFDSLREYVAGDDVRAIDWRSTARLGDTVVRTWLPERDRHVIIILDSGRAGTLRIGDAPAFDSYIESTLLFAALATRAGDRVSVISADSALRSRFSAGNSKSVLNEISESLADVEPRLAATDWTAITAQIRKVSANPSLVVLLTDVSVGTASADFLDAVSRVASRSALIIASPISADADTDLSTPAGVYEKAAGERARLEDASLGAELARMGAHVVQADPETLPAHVADAYLELKAFGKL